MRRFARILGVPLVTAALCATAACGNDGSSGSATPAAQERTLDVVVAFYPLQFTAERVAGEAATITNLTEPGADAHDVELTPRQVATLSEADLVIYQRGFQPVVDSAVEQVRPSHVLDVTAVVDMHGVDSAGQHEHAHGSVHDSDHGPEAEATAPENTAGDGHDHGAADPHQWLDVDNMARIADATAALLAEVRPDDRQVFRSNADGLKADLAGLDEAYRAGLATCQRREIVVSHAAFGYLTDRYDLTQIPIRGLNPDVEPSPARLAQVQQLAQEHAVTTIFYETLVSPAVAEAVAGDLGLKTDVLDPLEGLTPQSKGSNYLEVMNANLTALKAANECN